MPRREEERAWLPSCGAGRQFPRDGVADRSSTSRRPPANSRWSADASWMRYFRATAPSEAFDRGIDRNLDELVRLPVLVVDGAERRLLVGKTVPSHTHPRSTPFHEKGTSSRTHSTSIPSAVHIRSTTPFTMRSSIGMPSGVRESRTRTCDPGRGEHSLARAVAVWEPAPRHINAAPNTNQRMLVAFALVFVITSSRVTILPGRGVCLKGVLGFF